MSPGPHRVLSLSAALALAAALAHGQPPSEARVPIRDFCAAYELTPARPSRDDLLLTGRSSSLLFERSGKKLRFNGLLIWLTEGLLEAGDNSAVTRTDVESVLDPLLRPSISLANAGYFTVVLDPGHGGSDTGAVSRRKALEKRIVLDVARRARRKLHAYDLDVRLTRSWDYTLELPDRVRRAAEWNADLFVSIHVNSARNSDASGIETYILPPAGAASTAGANSRQPRRGNAFDAANMILAYYIHGQLVANAGGVDRGIRRARFEVLCSAPCPAVLLECGYASNREDEDKLIQADHREAIAEGIALGILSYVQNVRAAKECALY